MTRDPARCTRCGEEPRAAASVWGKRCRAVYEKGRRLRAKEALAEERRGRALDPAMRTLVGLAEMNDTRPDVRDRGVLTGITSMPHLQGEDLGRWERENAALRAMVKSLEQQIAELQFEATRERVGRG